MLLLTIRGGVDNFVITICSQFNELTRGDFDNRI